MADADRLRAIQDDYSRALEGRITTLMATVHAARDINRQIAEADSQIAIGRADLEGIQAELAEIPAGSEDAELGREQVEALNAAIADTEAYRDELVDALGKLSGEIGG